MDHRYPYPNHPAYPQVEGQIAPHSAAAMLAQLQMQPFAQPPPPMMPFNPQIMGLPPTSAVDAIPNFPFPGMAPAFSEQTVTASALERLHLPQDKITETGIIPNNPYYKLPAGIMVPLVPAHRNEYRAIDPRTLRLPFPKFPDENFLRMIDSYYANDSDRRDSDGWERKFVDTYLKQKEALSKMHSEMNERSST